MSIVSLWFYPEMFESHGGGWSRSRDELSAIIGYGDNDDDYVWIKSF